MTKRLSGPLSPKEIEDRFEEAARTLRRASATRNFTIDSSLVWPRFFSSCSRSGTHSFFSGNRLLWYIAFKTLAPSGPQ